MPKEEYNQHQNEYRQLLQSLKGIVEGLLISQVSNVWHVYGGLNRLHNAVEKIFKHGCRVFNHDGDPDCWVFIQGLNWLQPSLATSLTFPEEVEESIPTLVQCPRNDASVWLYKSLEGHTLSQKLSWLLSDREHLQSCFEKYAYFCQEKYGEATLICLRAVEQGQPSLLTEIDPCLYLSKWNFKDFHKTHRRCSSFPETQYMWQNGRNKSAQMKLLKQTSEGSQVVETSECSSTVMNNDIEKVLVGDIVLSEGENSTNNKIHLKGNSVSLQSSVDCSRKKMGYSEEMMAKFIVQKSHDVRCCKSLPNLLPSNRVNSSSEINLIMDAHKKSLNIKTTPHLNVQTSLRSGSQTLPSSPVRRHFLDSCDLSSLRLSKPPFVTDSETENSLATVNSLLSPSVLKIDYTSDSPSAGEQLVHTTQKCNVDSKTTSPRSISKSVITKKLTKPNEHCGTKTVKKWNSSKCTNVNSSSGSTDTLNPETYKLSDDSTLVLPTVGSECVRPCVRPSDLKLSLQSWNEVSSDPHSSSQYKKQEAKIRKRKTVIVGSAPEYAGEWLSDEIVSQGNAQIKLHKKSFIESGGGSILPMSTGFFPRPTQGQSLTSFLSSGQFSRPSAELDRENAHFSISEAMIAAIEQVKCNRQLRIVEETEVGDESDEEINHLKQRIRMRRRQCQEERQRHLMPISLLSDGKTDTTTTDQSVSPLSSSPGTPSESISTDDVDDLEVDEVKNLAQLKNAGLSVSMASLYSEADLSKHPPARTGTDIVVTETVVSAEGVALSLLRQFSEKHLPRASDLQWLVSEQDAPQQLLPLPTSWPVSPDEAEDLDMSQATPLRGTMEWAPPRPQVIFTLHPAPVRRVLMAKQNYRCAGCGMKVAPEYANKFRYCEYLGRYFCTGCHTNQLALIPGKVLTKWDFTRYPVSNFSYRLLDQMLGDPLFAIGDVSPGLYRKARQLERSRQLRMQLLYLKDFVLTCRFAEHLQEALRKEPVHLTTEVEKYSMQDLVHVKSGEMVTRLREHVGTSTQHVAECQLCQARGFVCELCLSKEVIFPWQLGKVARCSSCGACFHVTCWTPSPCPRCTRLSERRQSRESEHFIDKQNI